jgi:hypothetical protein
VTTNEVTLDFQRGERIGFDEAIFCQGKTVGHLVEILEAARARGARLLLTRFSSTQLDALPPALREGLDFEALSRTGYFGSPRPEAGAARVAVIAAGTSDAHVTREIRRTLSWSGVPSTLVHDVGVAGLWRLLDKLELIRSHPVVIVVAGMDAALPTVVGGLVGSVIIGVPTANGYGIAEGGQTALHSMLASCAPGVLVMNIENGYGAACAAMRVLRAIDGQVG